VLTTFQGQNENEKSLGNYCQFSHGIDIIVLSFLSNYGNGNKPSSNFGDCTIDSNGNGQNCESLANDITTCQAAGKKIFLSIGGDGASGSVVSQADAEGVAFTLWNSYASPNQ
jgi:chitinase